MNASTEHYRLGPDSGSVVIRTAREGLAGAAGHDLRIEVTRWSGEAYVDPAAAERARVEATFDVASLVVREGTGGIRPLTDRDRREIEATIRGKILDAARHPAITFASTAVQSAGDRATVTGDLTIRGVSRPVTFDAVRSDLDRRFTGRVPIVQTRWNITPYKGFLGTLRVADAVELAFDVTLVPA